MHKKTNKKTVSLCQVCIGDYRNKFIEELVSPGKNFEISIFVGEYYFGKTTHLSQYVRGLDQVTIVSNFTIGMKLALQLFNYSRVVRADVAVLELNPRIINTWLLLLIRKILNKKTVLWGHAWGRNKSTGINESIRRLQRNLASGLLLYTEQQRKELIQRYPKDNSEKYFVASNSLYFKREMKPPSKCGDSFIWVGRLIDDKKPILAVGAFLEVIDILPQECKLHIVGDGPLRSTIQQMISEDHCKNRVVLHGHISDYEQLKELFHSSIASISSGYVGLSITQSFSFGVPMIVAKDEPHAPEVESMVDGVNGAYFSSNSEKELANSIKSFYDDRELWFSRSQAIVQKCASTYSIERMVGGFEESIQ